MNTARILLVGVTMVLATVIGGTTTAHAQRKMLILIDASGSMSTVRTDGRTRFEAAKLRAQDKIVTEAASGLAGVAVYTFSDTTSTLQTVGFTDPTTASTKIGTLDLFTVGGGNTPLAGAMCDAVDALALEPAATRILEVASDGEENFTPTTHACFGLPSTDPSPPYSTDSWQNKVYNKVADTDGGMIVQIDLFDPTPIVGLAARVVSTNDPEAAVTANARRIAAVAASLGEGPPTLEEFFTQIALVSGGRLTVLHDESTQLPVFADLDGNSCVDRSDALLVARAFGQSGPPQEDALDLDLDGKVGFSDYALVTSHFTPGGCGTADPYVPRAPVVCHGGAPVVIDGKSIESGGITVDSRGACVIIIKNSLIVSGKNAINILGTAAIVVDNSILVGENAVVSSFGATLLSAANTVFHGKKAVTGAFVYIDRGGNVWE